MALNEECRPIVKDSVLEKNGPKPNDSIILEENRPIVTNILYKEIGPMNSTGSILEENMSNNNTGDEGIFLNDSLPQLNFDFDIMEVSLGYIVVRPTSLA